MFIRHTGKKQSKVKQLSLRTDHKLAKTLASERGKWHNLLTKYIERQISSTSEIHSLILNLIPQIIAARMFSDNSESHILTIEDWWSL